MRCHGLPTVPPTTHSRRRTALLPQLLFGYVHLEVPATLCGNTRRRTTLTAGRLLGLGDRSTLDRGRSPSTIPARSSPFPGPRGICLHSTISVPHVSVPRVEQAERTTPWERWEPALAAGRDSGYSFSHHLPPGWGVSHPAARSDAPRSLLLAPAVVFRHVARRARTGGGGDHL